MSTTHHLPAVQAFPSCLDLTVAHDVDGSNMSVIELGANLILFGKILLQALNQNWAIKLSRSISATLVPFRMEYMADLS